MAAVLAGRRVQPLIVDMVRRLRERPAKLGLRPDNRISSLLAQCIIDEIQVPPDLLRDAFEWIARSTREETSVIRRLYVARYGQILADTVSAAYMSSETNVGNLGGALANIALTRLGWSQDTGLTQELAERLSSLMKSREAVEKASGALAAMHIAYLSSGSGAPQTSCRREHHSQDCWAR